MIIEDQKLVRTRWINVQLDDKIAYRSLAISSLVWPFILTIPIYLAGLGKGILFLSFLLISAIFIAAGVLLKSLRDGMTSYQIGINERPTGVSVTSWHRAVFESPIAEYWIFNIGSRVLLLTYILHVVVSTIFLFVDVSSLKPEMAVILAGPLAALQFGTIILIAFRGNSLITGAGWILIVGGTIAGVAIHAISLSGISALAYIIALSILGPFQRFDGLNAIDDSIEHGPSQNEPHLTGPHMTFFGVGKGLMYRSYREGGLYFRARDCYALATIDEMAGRDDAGEFRQMSGDIHAGARLASAELASKLQAMGA